MKLPLIQFSIYPGYPHSQELVKRIIPLLHCSVIMLLVFLDCDGAKKDITIKHKGTA